ncbi:cysteine hydrolase family protein [Asticcacaulis sp. YBE204]|uniref:cysteine hydrolase family protein n=1 Tax=Asticcacaulis sp. YBE204 TaxID=1282363 RepID=UPI0003C3E90C|nr:cysteine hydrolase [Asticcacaulis sp. YBE204]ESQ78750.1 hypothetical protein AEYBE204_12250 [Asticcacaulis sp. YBE204]
MPLNLTFIPAQSPDAAPGAWRDYYCKWKSLTLDHIDPGLLDLIPELRAVSPKAPVFDKVTYSPWADGKLHDFLKGCSIDTVIVSGAETEVCVAATVLGAVDLGYRVVVVTDGICSSSDETHDAMVDIYHQRFSVHVSAATADTILKHWKT